MLELPSEVWAVVAKHALRPLPPAGREHVTWEQLHQQDLTVMMRLSMVRAARL